MIEQFLMQIAMTFGYAGVFISVLIGSASIIFPIPAFLVVFGAGAILDPLLVGLIAGLAAAIGELTGYGLGYGINLGSKKRIEKKWHKFFAHSEDLFHRYGGFIVIFLFALTPLPDDVVGLIAGALNYDVKKFFLASLLGKTILFIGIAYAGFYGIDIVNHVS